MANIFIIHGAFGKPEENWFPWLKSELEKLNHRLFIPSFPTPEGQTLGNWENVFDEYKQYLNEESIVIGHSLGPAFLLNIIQQLDKPIKAAFFISGFISLLGDEVFDSINKTFINKEFKWDKIHKNCRQFYIYHSDDDPYVPIIYANELADKLNESIKLIKNAGHFNEKSGYKKFGLLLEDINNLTA